MANKGVCQIKESLLLPNYALPILCIAVQKLQSKSLLTRRRKGAEISALLPNRASSTTFAGCYDSNNQKHDVGNGFLAYKRLQNNIHTYSGRSYWGENSNYYFTADFKKLNVYAPDGLIYVYEKATAPKGVVTCAKIYVKPPGPKPAQDNRIAIEPVYPV